MKQCKCEHWQECPVCAPRGFDAEGSRLPPEPTPLQAARARVEALERERDRNLERERDRNLERERDRNLERERDRNLDSINVANAIINKKNERIAELEAALDVALEALETLAKLGNGGHYGNSTGNVIAQEAIAKLKEVRREQT